MFIKKISYSVLLLALLGTLIPTIAFTQPEINPSIFEDNKVFGLEPDIEKKMKVARRLFSERRYQLSADMLEAIYDEYPHKGMIESMLRSCYDQLKQFGKVEILTLKMIKRMPGSIAYRLQLAEALAKQGSRKASHKVYADAIAIAGKEDARRHLMVVRSMINGGQDSLAAGHIRWAREEFLNQSLFGVEYGMLLEGQGEYKESAFEYLQVINKGDINQVGLAESKLMALLEFPTSQPDVESMLNAMADSASGGRVMKLLASHYLKTGDYELAYEMAIRQDSLEQLSGKPLYAFVKECNERKLSHEVVRMARLILSKYDDSRLRNSCYFYLASNLAELGKTDEALAIYDRAYAESTNLQTRADALYGSGWINFDYIGDFDKALLYFDSVVTYTPHGRSYINARKAIPHSLLRAGRLSQARAKFVEMGSLNLTEELIEEAVYHTALIDLFQQNYDSAQNTFQKMLVDYPRGYYINDAIQLILVMEEAAQNPDVLNNFSDALFFEYQRMEDSTVNRFKKIIDDESKILADVSIYRLTEISFNKGDSSLAMGLVGRLIDEFPDSYYTPFGVKIRADWLSQSVAGREEAKQLYRTLLEKNQEYPFVSEVRKKLRELEESGLIG